MVEIRTGRAGKPSVWSTRDLMVIAAIGVALGVVLVPVIYATMALHAALGPLGMATIWGLYVVPLLVAARVMGRPGATLLTSLLVPRFAADVRTIRAADMVRGAKGGFGGAYERLRRYSVPLLAGAVRHAERVALAMDSRAFGAHERRTYLRRLRLARPDLAFVTLFWLASLALVLLLHLPRTL